jgi:hypothetical protein
MKNSVQSSEGLEQEDFQTVLRAAGETETKQENIQDWLQLDDGDPGFQLLTEEETAAVILFYIFFFISTAYIIFFTYSCSTYFAF